MSSAAMDVETMWLGKSLVAGVPSEQGGETFQAFSPVDGSALEPVFVSASAEDVERAVKAAAAAAPALAATTGPIRARLLRDIADRLDAAAQPIIARAQLETALPVPRLTGELARTSNQMRHFAAFLEEGTWAMARIDTADPARTPPKPDLRSMMRPIGPVAVFGASNFPLAYSVAGGDTASALAAGNPVIVKAHPAHPGTSELVGKIVTEAVAASGLPAGVFSMLFDAGHAVGIQLVKHPLVKAVGFTGSFRGGRALMDIAAARPEPIPVYAEMGSSNPVFVLEHALASKGEQLATGLHGSFTLGGGQFCTKPGLVFVPDGVSHGETSPFTETLRSLTKQSPAFQLLTQGIAHVYRDKQASRTGLRTAEGTAGSNGFCAQTALTEISFDEFAADESMAEEVFGPTTLLIHASSKEQMLEAARSLHGHLTATILGTEEDLLANRELLAILETKAGRLIFNGFPTGVEVAHSQVHGGPYPATSDGRSTSVGSAAIFRFLRPVAYQGLPQAALPAELQDANPLKIPRLWNGSWSSTSAE